jgi:serine/threonine protein kinase
MDFAFRGTERFVIRRQLGAGGMGVVYEALDRQSETRVALKTLRHVEANALYRLKNEFRALQDMDHPNLVSLGELIEAGGEWFYTMELVEGDELLDYVRGQSSRRQLVSARISPVGELDTQPLSDERTTTELDPAAFAQGGAASLHEMPSPCDEERLRAALGQLALGLVALHAVGKVHRDVKPSNVLVTADGRVVLLDFGLITEAASEHQSAEAHAVGTAAYMAPEQAASKAVGPESDWYSVGVILYEALTGRLPFTGSALEIFMDKQRHEPPPPRTFLPSVPSDLDSLCVDLLHFDPGARPTGKDMLKRLGVAAQTGSSTASVATSFTQTPPFVGRLLELQTLREALRKVESGKPATVTVVGESGLGKSALIRHFVEELGRTDVVLLAGRCYERESVPYKAFDGVVDALSRYLRQLPDSDTAALLPRHAALLPRVFPVLGRVEMIAQAPAVLQDVKDPHELRSRVFAALRELLALLAERRVLILVIEDLQWADAESLLLLGDLMRLPDAPAVLLLVSARSEASLWAEPAADGAIECHIPGDVVHLSLAPLPVETAETLAQLLLDRAQSEAPSVSARAIAEEADGHPLYIDELVRHAAMSGGGGERLVLEEAIGARVAQLPAAAIHVLGLVAVAGAPLAQDVLSRAARLEPAAFARQVSLLRVANLVRTAGTRSAGLFEPYHDRVRQAVLTRMDRSRRTQHHRRLAVALESSGAATERPELLLRHLEAAGERKKAAACAEEAAERAAGALAFDRAAELYRAALRLGEHDDEARRMLRIFLADALANAGRGRAAAPVFMAAANGADPATRLECRRQAAEQYLISGHLERGLAALAALLDEIGVPLPKTPRRALLSILWHRAKLRLRGLDYVEKHPRQVAAETLTRLDVYKAAAHGLGMVDTVRGMDFQARGLLLALRTGETFRIARALHFEAPFRAAQGGRRALARARQLHAEACRLSDRAQDPYLLSWKPAGDGIIAYFEGRFRYAVRRVVEAEEAWQGTTTATAWERGSLRLFRLWSLVRAGAFLDLCVLYGEYTRDAARRGDRYAETTFRRSCNIVWLAQDKPDEARRDLVLASWSPPAGGFHLQHWFELKAKAEIGLYEGRAAAALADAEPELAALAASLLLRLQSVRAESRWLYGRLALAAGGRAAIARAARMARLLGQERTPWIQVWAGLLGAGVAVCRGDTRRALRRLDETIPLAEAHDMLGCAVAARRCQGRLLGGEAGARLIHDADAWLQGEGIRDPVRMTEVIAPGFGPPVP